MESPTPCSVTKSNLQCDPEPFLVGQEYDPWLQVATSPVYALDQSLDQGKGSEQGRL